MADRSIKRPAGKGSISVQAVASTAAALRAAREGSDAAAPGSSPTRARAASAAVMRAMTPSPALAAVIGSKPLPRAEATRRLWAYIRAHKLQDPGSKSLIHADASLRPVFKKAQVSTFEMTRLIGGHLK